MVPSKIEEILGVSSSSLKTTPLRTEEATRETEGKLVINSGADTEFSKIIAT